MADEKITEGASSVEEADFITLQFDGGEDIECEILGIFDVEDKEYIALLPDDDSEDVYIYRYNELPDDEFELLDIEDDEEFEKVSEEFDKLSIED
ncbi:MAG: DUF1292 domain-containing protein [Anaerovoracaceae bacterium]